MQEPIDKKPFRRLLKNIRSSGRSYKESVRVKHDIDVTVDDLIEIYKNQQGLCFYSKKHIDLNEIFIPYSPSAISADRKNNKVGYLKDNIVLCMRFFNNGRNVASQLQVDSFVSDVLNINYKMEKDILKKSKVYLIGAIESKKDAGAGWRKDITKSLNKMGVVVFDPICKPFVKDLSETKEIQDDLKKMREDREFSTLSKAMKEIRIYDLALVDKSDFIIFNYDPDSATCGSWEELFLANRSKKPIFMICEQGLSKIPLWMYGVLPYNYFYESVDKVLETLQKINEGELSIDSDRWRLLKHDYR